MYFVCARGGGGGVWWWLVGCVCDVYGGVCCCIPSVAYTLIPPKLVKKYQLTYYTIRHKIYQLAFDLRLCFYKEAP